MIGTSTTLDVLLKRAGKYQDGTTPTVLPRLSRTHLPGLCHELGFTRGAEIGVWKAGYSLQFCKEAPNMHMLCVDSWAQHDGWDDGKASSQDKIDEAYLIATQVLAEKNATIVRSFSSDAAAQVPDGSLDFCYIDGNHAYEHVLMDLIDWAPKVRAGGILAGHDYRIFPEKPYIQVVPAVLAYTAAHQITPWFLTAADRNPSWMWVVR